MRTRWAIPAVMLLFGALAAGCGDDVTKTTGGSGRIAFTSRRNRNAQIWVMNADGTNRTQLTNNRNQPTLT